MFMVRAVRVGGWRDSQVCGSVLHV